jgi:hypothetical protein
MALVWAHEIGAASAAISRFRLIAERLPRCKPAVAQIPRDARQSRMKTNVSVAMHDYASSIASDSNAIQLSASRAGQQQSNGTAAPLKVAASLARRRFHQRWIFPPILSPLNLG